MSTPALPEHYQSDAWLLLGMTRSRAGTLEYRGGRVIYTDEVGLVFDVELSELTDVRFPWYYFCGGVKFTLGREHYRLSFVRPNDASGGGEIGAGLRAGKIWKSILLRRP